MVASRQSDIRILGTAKAYAAMTRLIAAAAIVVLLASPIIGQQTVPPVRPGSGARVPALVTLYHLVSSLRVTE